MTNSINTHLRLNIPYTHNMNFNLKLLLIAFAKPNLVQNIYNALYVYFYDNFNSLS